MALTKWRSRSVFATSVGIKANGSSALRPIVGFINSSAGGRGTLSLTTDGSAVAGTAALLDLSTNSFRAPHRTTAVGGDTIGFGTNAGNNLGGSNGQIMLGAVAGSGEMGVFINGTAFVLQWPTAGGAVVANPYAPGVA